MRQWSPGATVSYSAMPNDRRRTCRPPHPGEHLREDYIPDSGFTITTFAEALGVSRRTISELVNGRRAVNADMALRLGRLFTQSTEFWLGLQRSVDLAAPCPISSWRPGDGSRSLASVRAGNRPMKINYHPNTDSLYIDLSEHASVESREVSAGVVLDYDAAGDLMRIDIDNASRKVPLERLVLTRMTAQIERIAG